MVLPRDGLDSGPSPYMLMACTTTSYWQCFLSLDKTKDPPAEEELWSNLSTSRKRNEGALEKNRQINDSNFPYFVNVFLFLLRVVLAMPK